MNVTRKTGAGTPRVAVFAAGGARLGLRAAGRGISPKEPRRGRGGGPAGRPAVGNWGDPPFGARGARNPGFRGSRRRARKRGAWETPDFAPDISNRSFGLIIQSVD